ncbi:hypothetical protein Pmani_024684 [Petrolisthes manimaculis]|uniref:Uncharacterized protein n=1 Tax=Petrolisthes manimaculis TaxID=1843537 RepID=A0AAE1P707_9EUCA|nr:hypothetical protein Pmani_024684 [Petrolisthes manimaculis]
MSGMFGGRPVTAMEELCEVGQQHGTLLTCYVLKLVTPAPLYPETVREALGHLHKKVQCLRQSIQTRGDTTWLTDATNDIIDFEVYEGDVDSAMMSLKTYRYTSDEGPLWCVRLLDGNRYPPLCQWPIVQSPLRPDTGIDLPSQDISMGSSHPDHSGGDASWAESLRADTSAGHSTRPDTGLGMDPNLGLMPLQRGEVFASNRANPVALPSYPLNADEIPPLVLPNGGMPPPPEPLLPLPHFLQLDLPPLPLRLPNGDHDPDHDSRYPVTPDRSNPSSAPSTPPLRHRTRRYAGSHHGATAAHGSGPAHLDLATVCEPVTTSTGTSTRSSLTDTTSSMSAYVESGSGSGPSSPRQAGAGAYSRSSNFPSVLLLGFHTGLVDGVTALKIINLLIRILDDVMTETPINNHQLGEVWAQGEAFDLIAERRNAMIADSALKERCLAERERRRHRMSCMNAVFRPVEAASEEPRHLTCRLNPSTTNRFLEKCKAEGVRFHSAFCALANSALIEVAMVREGRKSSYTIHSSHATDMRRYWEGDSFRALGCLSAPTHLSTVTSHRPCHRFWEGARDIQRDLQQELDKGTILQDAALQQLHPMTEEEYNQIFLCPGRRRVDYITQNLGNATPLLTAHGMVRPEYLEISTSVHKTNFSCCHTVYTFQGLLTITLDYNPNYLSDEMAKEYTDNIFIKLHDVL